MQRRPALVAALALTLALLAAGGATVLLRDGGDGDGAGTTSSTGLAGSTLPPLRVDQVRVTGTLTAAELEGSLGAPVPLPLTVEAAGGAGGGEFAGVAVAGGGTTIVWDGGRSLLLSGNGALQLERTRFTFDGSFLRVDLGGATHALGVGGYRVDTPVAVGGDGATQPRDGAAFSVEAAGATFRGTGEVSANLAAPAGSTFDLTGPGRVVLEGSLEVERPDGRAAAARVEMPSGSYTLTLAPREDGNWTVLALLQGAVTTA